MFNDTPATAAPALTLHDYWRMVCHRRWWILSALFVCWLGAWTASWIMPANYRSEALVLIEQPKVNTEDITARNVLDMQEQLESLKQQVLSRTRLAYIIEQFKLYETLRKRVGPEATVDEMRKDIKIEMVEPEGKKGGDLTAFRIAYLAPTAHLAQAVNTQLTSLFIDQNIQVAKEKANNATQFYDQELEDARAKLAGQEEKVKTFKAGHNGELPTQTETNVQILNGLNDRYRNLSVTLDHAQEQRDMLLAQHERLLTLSANGGEGKTVALPKLEEEISRLKAQLADLLTKYTEDHPDVKKLKRQIAKNERDRAALEKELSKPAESTAALPLTPSESGLAAPLTQNESQIKANAKEIEDTKRQMEETQAQIGAYQSRLNAEPMAEQKLADLTRDYEQSKQDYENLLKKKNQADQNQNLEERQLGQQLKIIDPASLPRKPYSPDRVKFSLVGLLGGLLMGIALLGTVEYMDDSVRGRQDAKVTGARVLVGIPHLTTPVEEQKDARRRHWEWCGAAFIAVCMIAGNVLVIYKG